MAVMVPRAAGGGKACAAAALPRAAQVRSGRAYFLIHFSKLSVLRALPSS
jgi:hypothetical protein